MLDSRAFPIFFFVIFLPTISTTCSNVTTASPHCVPDFYLIGATKAGSTAVWSRIQAHPCVASSDKETHLLTYNDAYHLPCQNTIRDLHKLYGDGTPEYIFLPGVAERAFHLNSNASIVAIVRDPIDRSVSNYKMTRRSRTYEKRGAFEEAIREELNCYGLTLPLLTASMDNAEMTAATIASATEATDVMSKKSTDALLADFNRCSLSGWEGLQNIKVAHKVAYPLMTSTYLSRSMYYPQLERWSSIFNDKLLVISQNSLAERESETMGRVFSHIGLDAGVEAEVEVEAGRTRTINRLRGYHTDLKRGTSEVLTALFAPYDELLFRRYGENIYK